MNTFFPIFIIVVISIFAILVLPVAFEILYRIAVFFYKIAVIMRFKLNLFHAKLLIEIVYRGSIAIRFFKNVGNKIKGHGWK